MTRPLSLAQGVSGLERCVEQRASYRELLEAFRAFELPAQVDADLWTRLFAVIDRIYGYTKEWPREGHEPGHIRACVIHLVARSLFRRHNEPDVAIAVTDAEARAALQPFSIRPIRWSAREPRRTSVGCTRARVPTS